MRGRITTIKHDRGFGFIRGEDGCDRFFHANGQLAGDAPFGQLVEGTAVEFEAFEETVHPITGQPLPPGRGLRARSIRSL